MKMPRAEFLEIKEAYAILFDAGQRAVYDRIFAEEMERFDVQRRQEEAEREAREAVYRDRVALVMCFAALGHNRDVVFGVLLGGDCDEASARQIADSAIALHESRHAAQATKETSEPSREEEKETAGAESVNLLGANVVLVSQQSEALIVTRGYIYCLVKR